MRILYISTLYSPEIIGGAERVVQLVAERLVERGHECHVATLGRSEMRVARELNGVTIHELPVRNLYWPFQTPRPSATRRALWHAVDSVNPRMASDVGFLLDEIKPDVVNSHNIAGFSVAVWSAIKKRNIPLVHTLHDQYLLCPNSTMFKGGSNCATQCKLCLVYSRPRIARSHQPDLVTGVSRFILERHRRFGCFSSVAERVIYNAYEQPSEARRIRKQGGEARLRFAFLGRLHESKGIEQLLDAWLTLPADAAELRIAGTGDAGYVASLQQKVASRRDVHWMGFVRPEDLLSESDVMVIPSLWHDTAPLVALEALAWGLPLVVSNRGGLPELAPRQVGWSFNPDEPRALAKLLRECVEQRKSISEKSRAALELSLQFSTEATLAGYLRAYSDVLH